jgi:GNAT superfamily N-acetyltransferase
MRLKSAAGWNQTEADWRRFLDLQPDGCFVAAFDGKPVGTLTTCIFGDVAWIAMVLVDAEYRGRGVGAGLMRHSLASLDQQEVSCVRLDATPLGQPLYEKLGFVADYTLHRYAGELSSDAPASEVAPLQPSDAPAVFRIDQETTQTDRRKLLIRMANEFPDKIRVFRGASGVEGFCLARPGTNALQFGPCIANERAGPPLLNDAAYQYRGQQVYIDIPDHHDLAVGWAAEAGLTPRRRLLRMCRGVKLAERVANLWASSGPEMG